MVAEDRCSSNPSNVCLQIQGIARNFAGRGPLSVAAYASKNSSYHRVLAVHKSKIVLNSMEVMLNDRVDRISPLELRSTNLCQRLGSGLCQANSAPLSQTSTRLPTTRSLVIANTRSPFLHVKTGPLIAAALVARCEHRSSHENESATTVLPPEEGAMHNMVGQTIISSLLVLLVHFLRCLS